MTILYSIENREDRHEIHRAARDLGYTLMHFEGYTKRTSLDSTGATLPAVQRNHDALREIQSLARRRLGHYVVLGDMADGDVLRSELAELLEQAADPRANWDG